MSKHHTEDYKLSAVLYYLSHDKNLRDTCEIFNCKFQSLARWIERYEKQGSVKRKDRDTKNLKITNEIEIFVKDHVKQFPTTILWELSKLVNDKFKVELSDSSIHNILSNHSITRKRVRSKYYPEKIVGQEQADIAEFYKKLNKFKYNKTICLDETSIYLNMVLPYGRSKSGTRVIKKTNKYPYKRYNCLCAISAKKVIGCILYEDLKGGVKTDNILEFYNKFIKDKYKEHLIIMDNAVIHKSKKIKELIESTDNKLLYNYNNLFILFIKITFPNCY